MNEQLSYLTSHPEPDTLRGRDGGVRVPNRGPGIVKRRSNHLTACRSCSTIYSNWLKHMNIQRGVYLRRLRQGSHFHDHKRDSYAAPS